MILRNAFISINGVDLSNECREVTVTDGRAEHDNTVMSHRADSVEAGLDQWTISVKLRQNYAAGKVHATVRPLLGTVVPIVVRPDAGPASATNEQITGQGIFLSYVPIGGAAGQPQEPTLEFKNAGTSLAYSITGSLFAERGADDRDESETGPPSPPRRRAADAVQEG